MISIFTRIFSGSILDLKNRDNLFFWLSQIAVICSTIVGVYLATSEGMRSAVEFHSITTLEKKYYTLNALNQEVASNNDLIYDYTQKYLIKDASGKATAHNGFRPPELNWFVRTTLSNSSESLDLPVDILRDANRYYLDLTDLIERLDRSSGREKLTLGVDLEELALETRKTLLMRMDTQLSEYQKHLQAYQGLGTY